MKEESVINVLMYLFHNHMTDRCELDSNAHHIITALKKAGFKSAAIYEALQWLETFVKEKMGLVSLPKPASTRVFSQEELDHINHKCLGFIIELEHQSILTPETREMVINQILALDSPHIDISLVKWVTLMVLINQPDNEGTLACMELLVLDNISNEAH